MTMIRGWAVHGPKDKLELFTFEAGSLGPDEVEIDIEHCGICHADLSMIKNEWGMSQYPLIPGHEVVGKVAALGSHAQNLQIGQRVGVGWNAISCMHCHECMTGQHNLCAKAVPTMVGHQGGMDMAFGPGGKFTTEARYFCIGQIVEFVNALVPIRQREDVEQNIQRRSEPRPNAVL